MNNPKIIECPVCKAAPGVICREANGKTLPWRASHQARIRQAQIAYQTPDDEEENTTRD